MNTMTKSLIFPAMITSMIMAGCATQKPTVSANPSGINALGWNGSHETAVNDSVTVVTVPSRTTHGISGGQRQVTDLPMTRIYKTNGDYADRVPVTLNQARNAIVAYPAPSDLRDSEPLKLADGFLLDRRGIGVNSAFTRWTYQEYAALPAAPSPKEILANIIPDARVTQLYEMPFTVGATDMTARCDSLIKAGLPGCKSLILSLKLGE